MVAKTRKTGTARKKKIKVLNLKKETVRDLTDGERKRVKGGDSYIYPVVVQSLNNGTLSVASMVSGRIRPSGG